MELDVRVLATNVRCDHYIRIAIRIIDITNMKQLGGNSFGSKHGLGGSIATGRLAMTSKVNVVMSTFPSSARPFVSRNRYKHAWLVKGNFLLLLHFPVLGRNNVRIPLVANKVDASDIPGVPIEFPDL